MSSTERGEPDWRERAVTRSLVQARTKAEERVQRLLDAADELMRAGAADLTVQDVVDRSGQSLRTFYQHFGGKNELMLALLEQTFEVMALEVERIAKKARNTEAGLEAALRYLYRASSPDAPIRRVALARFSGGLLNSDPAAFSRAQRPLLLVVARLVAEVNPTAADPERTASMLLNVIQGVARRNGVLTAQNLSPMTEDEMWLSVTGLIHPPAR